MPDEMLQYLGLVKEFDRYFLFGLKAYLILGAVDARLVWSGFDWMGMVDMFDYLSWTSPIDLWSKRWNKIIRNLLHAQSIRFQPTHSNKKDDDNEKKPTVGFFSTNTENFAFFTIHGLACMIESIYFPKNKPTSYTEKAIRIAGQLSFLVITGRLFLAPFLRHRFTEIIPLTYK
ncbi:hypothetical protein BD770DRAFT_447048 [Pilaira anomala]|nr:hypothetical protein BD770DRAFT_447048 [Pilaira anomala]